MRNPEYYRRKAAFAQIIAAQVENPEEKAIWERIVQNWLQKIPEAERAARPQLAKYDYSSQRLIGATA
jgi:hypothetical protein